MSTLAARFTVFLLLFLQVPLIYAQQRVQFYQTPTFAGGPALAVADFNSDGKPDLATGNAILLGNGDGTFRTPLNLSETGSLMVTDDLNGDGNPDLVVFDSSSTTVSVLLGQGRWYFSICHQL